MKSLAFQLYRVVCTVSLIIKGVLTNLVALPKYALLKKLIKAAK